jgi:hypothetical protein
MLSSIPYLSFATHPNSKYLMKYSVHSINRTRTSYHLFQQSVLTRHIVCRSLWVYVTDIRACVGLLSLYSTNVAWGHCQLEVLHQGTVSFIVNVSNLHQHVHRRYVGIPEVNTSLCADDVWEYLAISKYAGVVRTQPTDELSSGTLRISQSL